MKKSATVFAIKSRWILTSLWLPALILVLTGSGCGKKESVTPPAPAAPAADAGADGAQASGTPSAAEVTATLAKLNNELRRYLGTKPANPPRTFEEFIAQDTITFPPPPAGKVYFLWHNAIVLR
jgi:hypothetical protein